tara:strand:- start:640 stop:1470 length:831 start_codon:yes stop_codon:yes gene_type:complete
MGNWWNDLVDGVLGFGGNAVDFFTSKGGIQMLMDYGLSGWGQKQGWFDPNITPTGYQGGIPRYDAVRERVPMEYDPQRRPGSMGQRYFSDTFYAERPEGAKPMTVEEARIQAANQASGLAALNTGNKTAQAATRRPTYTTGTTTSTPASDVINTTPVDTGEEDEDEDAIQLTGNQTGGVAGGMRYGGIAYLNKGRYLNGMTDGMADRIPASIDGTQPAALSDGEFVIPADVVSHLGNGNSNAGAKELDQMLNRIRKERTGNPRQGKQINPNQFLQG